MDNTNTAADSLTRLQNLAATMIDMPATFVTMASDVDEATYTRAVNVTQHASRLCGIRFVDPQWTPRVTRAVAGYVLRLSRPRPPPMAPSTAGGQARAGPSGAEGTAALASSRRKKAKAAAAGPEASVESRGSSLPSPGTFEVSAGGGGGAPASASAAMAAAGCGATYIDDALD